MKQSDVLNREYNKNSRTIDKLTEKYKGDDSSLWLRLNEIMDRQDHIVDELKECTAIEKIVTLHILMDQHGK